MINELYNLTKAIDDAGIQTTTWHRKYKPIPKNAPCMRITIQNGNVIGISLVSPELAGEIRKYGTNQGTYPAMNLAPLYRISDEETKKAINTLKPEQLDEAKIEEIQSWCRQSNWESNFQGKYGISMVKTPKEMLELIPGYEPLRILVEESDAFQDPRRLHQEMENAAFQMLRSRENVYLALQILFYLEKSKTSAESSYGSISVALETPRLIEMGTPAISEQFVAGLNNALLLTAASERGEEKDAFGYRYSPVGEPMPAVKLAAGFDVVLRTMNKDIPCQTRYGRTGDESYPISLAMRNSLSASMAWLGSYEERRNITWTNTDKNEALFVYPDSLPKTNTAFTKMFRRPKDSKKSFETEAKDFLTELRHGKEADTDSKAKHIQIFILRKIDKARTKVVYTRQTDPVELEKRSEEWTAGAGNLPYSSFGSIATPFPLNTADILNQFWKQDGSPATDKFKPIPKYHGMELLMEEKWDTTADLFLLAEKGMTIGPLLGDKLAKKENLETIIGNVKNMLALMGLLLYRRGVRKGMYMDSLPYLYGQLLKISDELHILYCATERKGDFPSQLVGSGLYQATAEAPVRTFDLLSKRMNPYITWAKTYRKKNILEKGKESWRAGWLMDMYEKTASKIAAEWKPQARFNDEEKALLFIGYLAAFSKKEETADSAEYKNITEEEN